MFKLAISFSMANVVVVWQHYGLVVWYPGFGKKYGFSMANWQDTSSVLTILWPLEWKATLRQ